MKVSEWLGWLFFIAFLAAIFTPSFFADDGNYQNYIIGERAAGMGGAVVASSRDLDASYYNPAGLGLVTANRLSLSTSLYGLYRYRVEDGLGEGKDYKVREFETIPSVFGSVLKLSDKIVLSFSAYVPDDISYNHEQAFELKPTSTAGQLQSDYFSYLVDDQSLWVGPSAGYRLADDLSLGASLFVVYRSVVFKENWSYLFTQAATKEIISLGNMTYNVNFTNYSLLGMIGARYDLTRNFLLGATVQTPNLNLRGQGELLYTRIFKKPDDILIHSDDMKSRNRLPTKITAGAAYQQPGAYTLEADVSYYFPVSFDQLEGTDVWSGQELKNELRRRAVVNTNLGGEYYFARDYPLRLGFFTNLSSAVEPQPEIPVNTEKVEMYGLTASIGNESEHTTINLGINYVWGSGKTLGVDENMLIKTVHVSESYFFLFVSSSYIF